MKHDVTPEEKTGDVENGPPAKHFNDTDRCIGCPYPGVGFICWSSDGFCMRTDVEKFSRRSKGR